MRYKSAMWAVCLAIGGFAASLCATPLEVRAQRGASTTAARPDTTFSATRENARALAQADSLRRAILGFATFAGFASTPCGGIDLRTFERDTTQKRVPALLSRLELLVLSYGVSAPLNNEPGRALLRAVVRLEAGGPAPRWDVLAGAAPRSFNPILPTSLYNPQDKKCEATPGEQPDAMILPATNGFTAPTDSGTPAIHVRYGTEGINSLRDMFYARFKDDTSAVLRLTRVNAYAVWQGYAIVSVVRERQRRGITPIEGATTGSVYAFHRVGQEWRLLALVRSW